MDIELRKKIISWAEERDIFKKSNPMVQAIKTREEVLELLDAIELNDKKEITDAIGDIIVTLVIQCKMQNLDIDKCVESAYNEISQRTGTIKNGVFVKDEKK